MKKTFITTNAIMLALILIFDVCYMIKGGLFFKSIASMLFVGTGFINLKYCMNNKTNLRFPIWMMVALIWAMIGDILIVTNFILGAAAFAVGHIFYFVAYCMLDKINRRDFLCGISIMAIALSIILFIPFLDFESQLMLGVCCTYAVIISFMVGKAISNVWQEKNLLNKVIVVGSILFFISDFMLMLDVFGNISTASYLCLATYYPAQFLLAFSLLISGSKKFVW
ncbi:MAG: lysoplasmalogenase [Cellulosilyticum sp.]|nr:lysoplasmalogenase [Cellulosilyticum sp.]